MYNTSDLVLEWEEHSPISFDPEMRMTEYTLADFWHNKSNVVSDDVNLRHGAFSKFPWGFNLLPYANSFSVFFHSGQLQFVELYGQLAS